MAARVKHTPNTSMIHRVYEHWDAEEELCGLCKLWWLARSHSFRKEVRHTYEFEAD